MWRCSKLTTSTLKERVGAKGRAALGILIDDMLSTTKAVSWFLQALGLLVFLRVCG